MRATIVAGIGTIITNNPITQVRLEYLIQSKASAPTNPITDRMMLTDNP